MATREPASRGPRPGVTGALIATVLLVLGIALAVSAIRPGTANPTDGGVAGAPDPSAREQVILDFGRIDRAARTYLEHHGRWPRDLAELAADPSSELGGSPIDPYSRRAYHCERLENGFRLVCLGADRARGGSGPDADLILTVGGVA